MSATGAGRLRECVNISLYELELKQPGFVNVAVSHLPLVSVLTGFHANSEVLTPNNDYVFITVNHNNHGPLVVVVINLLLPTDQK